MCMGGSSNQVQPTMDQQTQANINDSMWQYYQTSYKPVLNKYIASRTDPKTTDAEKKQVAGKINADIMKQVKPASRNPVANTKAMANVADIKGKATQTGKTGEDVRVAGEKQNLINIGRGQETKTMAGLDDIAGISVAGAISDKERQEQLDASTENAIGSGIGAIAGAGLGYEQGAQNRAAMKKLTYDPNSLQLP
jgi:hypothetical protein